MPTEAWRVFEVRVSRLERLSPSFLRVTFTGDDLDLFADNGFDQRFKVLFPQRRTYTVRAVRPELSEVDVDMVLHPEGGGPAARWLERAAVGDELAFIGPDVRYRGVHGGIEFEPPPGTTTVLFAGDETAVPAIGAIMERLPEDLAAQAFLEVPTAADILPLPTKAHAGISWHARMSWHPDASGRPDANRYPDASGRPDANRYDSKAHRDVPQQDLVAAVKAAAADLDREGLYVWLAGEAGTVTTLRRYFVNELGLSKKSVEFMGYWRRGHAEE